MESCIIFNYNHPPEHTTDMVCGMNTDKSEAYEYNYKGKKYYFDTYNCKQIFKQNPQKFIDNQCVQIK
ncbi:MAG: YHS domain-containing protein [Bacteroidetes bacterium]|nr:YHS domain-containing protein [Bacteroidota bacterium]